MADNSQLPRKIIVTNDGMAAFRDHFDPYSEDEIGDQGIHDQADIGDEFHDAQPVSRAGSSRTPRPPRTTAPSHKRSAVLIALMAGAIISGSLALFYGLWALDVHDRNVARNVTVAGRPIGGLSPEKLTAALANLNAEYQSIKIHVKTENGPLDTTAGELGIGIDVNRTFAAAIAVGHRGPVLPRAWNWAGSILGGDINVKIPIVVDNTKFVATVSQLEQISLKPPTEPTVTLNNDDQFVVTPGIPGIGLDIAALLSSVPRELPGTAKGFTPLELTAKRLVINPKFSDATAKTLADQANTVATTSLTIEVNGLAKTINPHRVRTWLMPVIGPDTAALGINNDLISKQLSSIFDSAAEPGNNARAFIDDTGQVAFKEGTTGHGCCAEAPSLILNALVTKRETPTKLELHTIPPSITVADLQKLGIKEIVGEATTYQACCGNRQKNIQKIADATNGWLVMPGETFSLNAVTGIRTIAKGWFMAAGIEGAGGHKNQPGGGVSQYTTTLFNAAFKAGLPVRGQAHTVHFDRYPYGIEATLSFPTPDLKFTNNTPYAILIWNSYTNDTVTAQLWSTRFAYGTASQPQIEKLELCEKWTVFRTITYISDKHTAQDKFTGTYYPDGAANCHGDPAPKYDEQGNEITTTTSTTTLPGATTTVDPNAPTTTSTAPPATTTTVKP